MLFSIVVRPLEIAVKLVFLADNQTDKIESVTADGAGADPGRAGVASITVRGQNLTAASASQRPPGLLVDRVLHEAHATITHTDVDTAGMVARGVGVLAKGKPAITAIQPAASPLILFRVGRHNRIEHGDATAAHCPAKPFVIRSGRVLTGLPVLSAQRKVGHERGQVRPSVE